MRKKPNLGPRMERCARLLIAHPEEQRGRWRELMPQRCGAASGAGMRQGPFYRGDGGAESTGRSIHRGGAGAGRHGASPHRARDCAHGAAQRLFWWTGTSRPSCRKYFAPGEVDRIYINFCDPWPTNRHAKRRLTHRGLPAAVTGRSWQEAGQIHFKTDNRMSTESVLFQFPQGGFWGIWDHPRPARRRHPRCNDRLRGEVPRPGDPDQPLCGYHGPAARSAGASSRGMTAQKETPLYGGSSFTCAQRNATTRYMSMK